MDWFSLPRAALAILSAPALHAQPAVLYDLVPSAREASGSFGFTLMLTQGTSPQAHRDDVELRPHNRAMRRRRVLTVLLALTSLLAPTASAQVGTTAAPSDRRWVVQAGAGSPYAWNIVGLTRELSGGPLRPFVTIGFGSFLVGGGVTYYTNPDRTGIVLSLAAGGVGAQAAAGLDLRLSQRARLVIGASYGSYFLQYTGPLPIASLHVRL